MRCKSTNNSRKLLLGSVRKSVTTWFEKWNFGPIWRTSGKTSLDRGFWGHESSPTSPNDAEFKNVIKKRKFHGLTIIRSTTMVVDLWSKWVKTGHFEFQPSFLSPWELPVIVKWLRIQKRYKKTKISWFESNRLTIIRSTTMVVDLGSK